MKKIKTVFITVILIVAIAGITIGAIRIIDAVSTVEVSLTKTKMILGTGESYNLKDNLKLSRDADVTWTSENNAVATVDENGVINAKSAGNDTITVTCRKRSASAKITVKTVPENASFTKKSVTMGCGETLDFNTFLSGDLDGLIRSHNITGDNATVDENGIVTAKKAGQTTVEFKICNNLTAACALKIAEAPTTVKLSDDSLNLGVGQSCELERTLNKGAAAYKTEYISSDENVVVINENGVVSAKSEGNAKITCRTYNGVEADCDISVTKLPDGIRPGLDPNKKMIALTFDDGPYYPSTERILKVLKNYDARATFFVVGNRLAGDNETACKDAAEMGCQIGNHTYSHQYLNSLSESAAVAEIQKCSDAVKNATGKRPTVMRTPGGITTQTVKDNLQTPVLLWSIDTRDWATHNATSSYNAVIDNAYDGAVVLMHDLYIPSAEAAEKIVPKLSAMGYQMVTVDELAYYREINLKKGEVYNDITK